MSITIGKRSFNETISELSHERILHQQADFRRSKNNLNSNDSTFEMLQSKQKNLLNLEALFPNKSKNELIQLMEDFDYDMDLLIDVLKKQNKEITIQMNNSDPNRKQREIKNLKTLVHKKELSLINAQKNEMHLEEAGKKSKEEILNNSKEDMISNDSLIRNIAEELVKKLQSSQNLNDAFIDVVSAMKFFEDQLNLNSLNKDQKINQENSLLKKAFYKQFKKTEDLEKNYQRVVNEFEKNKEELRKSQNLNYSLSLIVKSLDSNQTNSFNHEIY